MNMYNIVVSGKEIGRNKYHKFILILCPICKSKRWLDIRGTRRKPFTGVCEKCLPKYRSGAKSPRWKGGKIIDSKGYVMVKFRGHPFADKNGYVLEHRLIMADLIGIEYVTDMIVHHKDGDRQNNNPNNLELITRSKHSSMHNRTSETTTKLKDDPNPEIFCKCGCKQIRLKYDNRNRPRMYIIGHHKRARL